MTNFDKFLYITELRKVRLYITSYENLRIKSLFLNRMRKILYIVRYEKPNFLRLVVSANIMLVKQNTSFHN